MTTEPVLIAAAFWLSLFGLCRHPFDPASPLNPFRHDMPPTAAM
jgi:hypothetical protein